jgi:cytochrome c556
VSLPRLSRLSGLFAGVVAVGALTPDAHASERKDAIDYRRHIMNTLNEQSGALGQILSTAIPNDNAVAHLQAIALTASIALKAFEPRVNGGEARPEVWSDWPGFSRRMKEFADRTAAVAKVAAEQGPEAVSANILDVLTCKACHDVYRDERQKK